MLLVCLMHLFKLFCREMACYPSFEVSLLLSSSVVLVQGLGCSSAEELVSDVVPVDGLLSMCVLCAVFLCSSCPGCSDVEELVSDVVPVDGLLSMCVLCAVFLCSSCPGCSDVEELVSDVVPVDGLLSMCVLCAVFLCSSCPGCSDVEELVNDVVLVGDLLSTCVLREVVFSVMLYQASAWTMTLLSKLVLVGLVSVVVVLKIFIVLVQSFTIVPL